MRKKGRAFLGRAFSYFTSFTLTALFPQFQRKDSRQISVYFLDVFLDTHIPIFLLPFVASKKSDRATFSRHLFSFSICRLLVLLCLPTSPSSLTIEHTIPRIFVRAGCTNQAFTLLPPPLFLLAATPVKCQRKELTKKDVRRRSFQSIVSPRRPRGPWRRRWRRRPRRAFDDDGWWCLLRFIFRRPQRCYQQPRPRSGWRERADG